jgi:hypothetical protein
MWKLKPDDRLDRWKQFRKRLGTLPIESALAECAEFWQNAPFTPYYLDHLDQENWPDPWQLVYENYYCDLAKALGIVYTLHLSEHGKELSMSIKVYQDPLTRGQYNLAWIDQGKYVLNFIADEIVNRTQIPKELKLLTELSSQDLKLHSY